jgi:hypothetical protein
MNNYSGVSQIQEQCEKATGMLAKWDYQFTYSPPYTSFYDSPSDLKKIDSKANTTVNILDFSPGKSKQLTLQGEENYQKYIKDIKKLAKENPKDSIEVDGTGFSSNQGIKNKFSNKADDSKDPLDVARTKTITNKLKNDLGDISNIKVSEKPNTPDAYKSQKIDPNAKVQGAVVTTHIDKKDIPVEDPIKLLPQFAPEYVKLEKNPKVQTEPGTEEPITVLPKPIKTAPVIPDTEVTTKVSNLSKLNRNGQIATVLATINPSLDISKALKADAIDSYTDKFLTTTQGDARKLAALILNIRKNPDALLKKVSKALDIKLEPRAKAVATKPGTATQAQLQPVKESISMIHLLEEAMIDQISDEDIKKNKKAILAFLGTMYASAGNTQLSVVPKNVADKEELVSLGFTPQPAGNYIFLGGQTKAQALGFDTLQNKNKTQPDVTNVSKTLKTRTNYKSLLKRIDTVNEFSELILNIFDQVDPGFKNDKNKVKSTLFSLRNRIALKEEEKDVTSVVSTILKDSIFSNLLKKINTIEEAIQLILRDIIPYLNPNLIKDKTKLKNAIIGAANQYSKQQTTPTK